MENKQIIDQRAYNLDFLRVFATFAVVVLHMSAQNWITADHFSSAGIFPSKKFSANTFSGLLQHFYFGRLSMQQNIISTMETS